MKLKEYKDIVKKDKENWKKELGKEKLNFFILFLFLREYKIVVLFRLCSLFKGRKLLMPLYLFIRFYYRYFSLKNGCEIPTSTKIGGGLVIHHCSGIVINSESKIGENFVIRTGCVIGKKSNGVPNIKNNVTMGVHSIIIGNILCEDNSYIAAGAVVTKSTEKNGIYAGIPAKLIKKTR